MIGFDDSLSVQLHKNLQKPNVLVFPLRVNRSLVSVTFKRNVAFALRSRCFHEHEFFLEAFSFSISKLRQCSVSPPVSCRFHATTLQWIACWVKPWIGESSIVSVKHLIRISRTVVIQLLRVLSQSRLAREGYCCSSRKLLAWNRGKFLICHCFPVVSRLFAWFCSLQVCRRLASKRCNTDGVYVMLRCHNCSNRILIARNWLNRISTVPSWFNFLNLSICFPLCIVERGLH